MKLPVPIHRLRRRARLLSRERNIPLHEALDRTAAREGYAAWSLLAARSNADKTAGRILARLNPGDLILLAGRPGQGKTLLALQLAVEATKSGRRSSFYSLECTEEGVGRHLRSVGDDPARLGALFTFDGADDISADHIAKTMASAARGTLAVVDYLQVLDQKRGSPDLATQMKALRSFARDRGVILAFISQIDRTFEGAGRPFPDWRDVRLPNPLDLSLFDKACFLNGGELRYDAPNWPSAEAARSGP